MTEQIKIENAENILTLTFARPDKKNALTMSCMARSRTPS
jgi:enoyl-CoA hydratase/carnithine racemase